MTEEELGKQKRSRLCKLYFHEFFVSEFSWKSFGCNHERPEDFIDSQWLWMKPWLFTTYRVLLSLGCLVWICFDIPREIHNYFHDKTHIWFVYATNWSFGLLTLAFFLLALYCLIYNCPRRKDATLILYGPIWLIYIIALDTIIVVSIVYWVALANSNLGVFSSIWGKLKHSLAACLAVLDLFISSIPVRLAHAVYPILIGLIYAVFSYLFWLGGGEGPLGVGQVYPGLNWIHPKTAILSCLCALLFSFLIHILIYVTYYIRVKLSTCVGGRQAETVKQMKEGYKDLRSDVENELRDDVASEGSVTTWMEDRTGRYYGTVE
ncbi:Protein rolling stone [Clonorchis sinensis]|uniref:Protein rolling stone n=2 Tax=Clonorchis sinensis TaxID=79923 RepID=A0A8T1MFW5_CLOSI|nr:Protein rolling stone [Clonorchis sinensis]GAA49786.1 hypothetical protein CLF_103597 [Clonorchis sinensis]